MAYTHSEALSLLDDRLAIMTSAGLVPAPGPISHETLDLAMRTMLLKMAVLALEKNDRIPGCRFGSAEEYVLELAKPVQANVGEMQSVSLEPYQCFRNAFHVAQTSEVFRYCEGFALMDGMAEPVHHAWLVGLNGDIEDPTWRPLLELKRETQPQRVWSGNAIYRGVSVDDSWHRVWTAERGEPNLLSVHDVEVLDALCDRLPID